MRPFRDPHAYSGTAAGCPGEERERVPADEFLVGPPEHALGSRIHGRETIEAIEGQHPSIRVAAHGAQEPGVAVELEARATQCPADGEGDGDEHGDLNPCDDRRVGGGREMSVPWEAGNRSQKGSK